LCHAWAEGYAKKYFGNNDKIWVDKCHEYARMVKKVIDIAGKGCDV
jgi:hypothetical protein